MRCAACTRNDDFQPAICRAFGIVIKPFRGAVCGHDLAFMRNIQHRQYFGGMRPGVPSGTAPHYDADQRLSLRHVASWFLALARGEKRWPLTREIRSGNVGRLNITYATKISLHTEARVVSEKVVRT